ncbi:uncharacterized protein LOC133316915 [Gastrolobium bilobum]|uniref:uncharacterized protein LOC133316915 n=1 Tax=Gastrolobium bilobum TaxID=150636 RepID=UPI002AAFDB00|nr:uncharacterized protein LOC133316915 [Gastrolobium bilobum]
MQGHVITWLFFEDCFLGRYFPYDEQEWKQGEFDKLVLGSLSVDEYLAKFNELVKFARFRMERPTLIFLAAKFRMGLSEDIAGYLVGSASRDFGTLVQQCRDIEDLCNSSKAKIADTKGTNSSTSWKDENFAGKGKDAADFCMCS